jgi:hypothetical protein
MFTVFCQIKEESFLNGLLRAREGRFICIVMIQIFLTAIGLTPGGSSTVHIYTQTVPRIHRMEHI